MAKVLTQADAKSMGLPGRKSLEIVSGEKGSQAVTLRLVEIPVTAPGDKPRPMHFHKGFEECIHVMSGEGYTETEGGGRHALKAGDTILIPSGEKHATRNTGKEPLVLLCFFPVADISKRTEEQKG